MTVTNDLGGVSIGEPQAPKLSRSVTMFQALGGVVDQAAAVASCVVADVDALARVAPELRTALIRLTDAVYDVDFRLGNQL